MRLHLVGLCFTLALMTGCGMFKPGWVRDSEGVVQENEGESIPYVEGPTNGHFDEEGNWIPNNPDIARTYQIPDIGAGFVFDINSLDLSPSLQLELLEVDTSVPYVGTLKLDFGVAYQRSYLYVGKLWTSIFEISTGGFVGWNWEDNEISYGVAGTIIKF